MATQPVHLQHKDTLLELFATSPLPSKTFAREHGIPWSTFRCWLHPDPTVTPHLTRTQQAQILELAGSLQTPTLTQLILAWRQANELGPDERVPTRATFRSLCRRHGIEFELPSRASSAPKDPRKLLPEAPSTFTVPCLPAEPKPVPTAQELAQQAEKLRQTRYTAAHRLIPDAQMNQVYPCDLSDAQWAFVAPFMLPEDDAPGRRFENPRLTLNAILYVLKTGCPWRYLPKDYPDWNTTYKAFQSLQAQGTLTRLVDALRELDRAKKKRHTKPTVGIADTQSVKTTEKGGSAVMTPTSV